MYFSGDAVGLSVLRPVEISGQWEALSSTVGSLSRESASVVGRAATANVLTVDSTEDGWRGCCCGLS